MGWSYGGRLVGTMELGYRDGVVRSDAGGSGYGYLGIGWRRLFFGYFVFYRRRFR